MIHDAAQSTDRSRQGGKTAEHDAVECVILGQSKSFFRSLPAQWMHDI